MFRTRSFGRCSEHLHDFRNVVRSGLSLLGVWFWLRDDSYKNNITVLLLVIFNLMELQSFHFHFSKP